MVVALVGVLLAAGLAIGSREVNIANEHRLLRQRASAVGLVASAAIPNTQQPLTSGAVLAEATKGAEAPFRGLMQPLVPTRFVSISLWRTGATAPLLVLGSAPELASEPAGAIASFMRHAVGRPTFAVNDLFQSADRRLGYGFALSQQAHFFVYAESALPRARRATIATNSAFSDLTYALFVGKSADPANLLASSTGGGELRGHTASTTIGFGDTSLFILIGARHQLGGWLLANLWWLLALLMLFATFGAVVLVNRLTRRRRQAEALAIENGQLYAAQRSVALTLQHSLLSEDFPELRGVEIGARYVAGTQDIEIGGDWYDVVELDDGCALIAVGDVSGRGLHAATTMASLRFAVRAYAKQGDAPATILTKLSELVTIGRDGHFATTLCAVLDLTRGRLTCANAGHPEPLLWSDANASFVRTEVGPPVGVVHGARYREVVVDLPAAGTLLFYTDGLVERRGESLDVGLARLARAVEGHDGSLESTLSSVLHEAIPEGSADDTALLGVRWKS